MFRTFARHFLPNKLDWMLKKAAKRECKSVLLCWNRGLGDIALGMAAIVHRIRTFLPDAKIAVLTRENLKEGFSLLPGIEVLVAPDWKRGVPYARPNLDFDLIIDHPSPTDWCRWQHKTFTPKLAWPSSLDELWKTFDLPDGFIYIGVQVSAETNYGLWRNWPLERWQELFDRLEKRGNVRVLLFGYGDFPKFPHPMVIDLRGKTSFFELFSILKNRCYALIGPDSGVLSIAYYLDASFPLRAISLWADPHHGILKQGVPSPNPQLVHIPLIGAHRNLSTISAEQVLSALFPLPAPLLHCPQAESIVSDSIDKTACLILAGGQGSRLGFSGPKGLFPLFGKPLFQYHLEKLPLHIPLAVMTSPLNHEEISLYFRQHVSRKVHFFQQEMIPLLTEQYHPTVLAPNGNGNVYKSLVQSGLLDQFEQNGIDTLVIVPIENPLAEGADAKLVAFHRQNRADVTIKCVERKKGESMGVLVEKDGKLGIAEYFDVVEDLYQYSYTGQVALSTTFIRKAAGFELPYRWVQKNKLWKREQLLFDAFFAAERAQALCYRREMCYAPIKGAENIESVKQLLGIV